MSTHHRPSGPAPADLFQLQRDVCEAERANDFARCCVLSGRLDAVDAPSHDIWIADLRDRLDRVLRREGR